MKRKLLFKECTDYCGFDNLPEGIEAFYDDFLGETEENLIDRKYLARIFEKYDLPRDKHFRTHREGHNLDRCRTQLKLVEDMERKWNP